MDEVTWNSCTDPQAMLEFLGERVSARKLRLFACACCRDLWHLLLDERSRWAVEVAERFADERADHAELGAACSAAPYSGPDCPVLGDDTFRFYDAADAAACACSPSIGVHRTLEVAQAVSAHAYAANEGGEADARQSAWLRCLFGDRFHERELFPSVLAWEDGTVVRLAESIYQERHLPSGHLDITRLAVLADALEEAGCNSAELLEHLRSPGPHVRGCWAVDQLLAKG